MNRTLLYALVAAQLTGPQKAWSMDCERWLSLPKLTSRTQSADSILRRWPRVSVRGSLYDSAIPSRGFVRWPHSRNLQGVYGDLKTLKISRKYSLLTVTDRKGRIHVFDLSDPLDIYDSREASADEIRHLERLGEQKLIRIDRRQFELAMNQLNNERRQSLIKDSIQAHKIKHIQNAYTKLMKLAALSTPAVLVFWNASYLLRDFGVIEGDFFQLHSSNFYLGLLGMASVHSAISSVCPKARHIGLGVAVALNLTANIFEEIDFKLGQSDWIDFSSGALASLFYVGVYLWIEAQSRNTNFNSLIPNNSTSALHQSLRDWKAWCIPFK